jgi:hypothetical protein
MGATGAAGAMGVGGATGAAGRFSLGVLRSSTTVTRPSTHTCQCSNESESLLSSSLSGFNAMQCSPSL